MRPALRLPFLPSFTFTPFTTSVMSPPLQVISISFHSPSFFSTASFVSILKKWRSTFGFCRASSTSSFASGGFVRSRSPARPVSSCASIDVGQYFSS